MTKVKRVEWGEGGGDCEGGGEGDSEGGGAGGAVGGCEGGVVGGCEGGAVGGAMGGAEGGVEGGVEGGRGRWRGRRLGFRVNSILFKLHQTHTISLENEHKDPPHPTPIQRTLFLERFLGGGRVDSDTLGGLGRLLRLRL